MKSRNEWLLSELGRAMAEAPALLSSGGAEEGLLKDICYLTKEECEYLEVVQ